VEGVTFQIGLAGSRGIEGSEDMEKGAFAASTGTGDGNDFTGQNFEGDTPQGIDLSIACLVGLMKIACFDHELRAVRDK
jgi:hypothetical protein